MNKIKRLITNVHFWIWAAMHSREFHRFEILLYPGINASWGKGDYNHNGFYVHVSFEKPRISYNVSGFVADKYAQSCGISVHEIYTMDDIPF